MVLDSALLPLVNSFLCMLKLVPPLGVVLGSARMDLQRMFHGGVAPAPLFVLLSSSIHFGACIFIVHIREFSMSCQGAIDGRMGINPDFWTMERITIRIEESQPRE